MKKTLALLALALSLGASTSFANLVVNGSFEAVQLGSPYYSYNPADWPSWTHSGDGDQPLWAIGYSDIGGSVTVAGDGNQFVTMGGGYAEVGFASFDQILTGLTPGQSYSLTFKMACETSDVGQSMTVDFLSGSATPAQTFSAAPSSVWYWHDWESKGMTFTANDASVDLRFSADVFQDVGLDSVDVEAIPEPGTLATSALILGAGAWLRRRRS